VYKAVSNNMTFLMIDIYNFNEIDLIMNCYYKIIIRIEIADCSILIQLKN